MQQRLDGGFLAQAAAQYPGVSYRVEGLAVQQETAESLGPLFLMAMFAIFALLAVPLKSYSQPLIVMSVLPFAFVGGVWGHVIMKPFGDITGLSAPSVFGVIAACGVVVNATLVLLHTVNGHRAAGDSLDDALVKAVVERCRPIVITSVTTFGGVAPLMLSKSVQALPLIPMAVSLAFGVLVSAVAALFVVPPFWLALHNVSRGARRVGGLLGDLAGTAPRMSMWMARYPYIEESLRQQEFVDLQIDEDLGLSPEAARVAQRGLVRPLLQARIRPRGNARSTGRNRRAVAHGRRPRRRSAHLGRTEVIPGRRAHAARRHHAGGRRAPSLGHPLRRPRYADERSQGRVLRRERIRSRRPRRAGRAGCGGPAGTRHGKSLRHAAAA